VRAFRDSGAGDSWSGLAFMHRPCGIPAGELEHAAGRAGMRRRSGESASQPPEVALQLHPQPELGAVALRLRRLCAGLPRLCVRASIPVSLILLHPFTWRPGLRSAPAGWPFTTLCGEETVILEMVLQLQLWGFACRPRSR
jgi:hypothetical protein